MDFKWYVKIIVCTEFCMEFRMVPQWARRCASYGVVVVIGRGSNMIRFG